MPVLPVKNNYLKSYKTYELEALMITFKLNDKIVQAEQGQYLLEVARKNCVEIPTLCYHQALEPGGMCRMCAVEVQEGRRSRVVTSCNYPVSEGIEVRTDTEALRKGRRLIVELLLARCPETPFVQELARSYGVTETRFIKEHDDCIVCGLCTRICEKMGNSAISLTGRGVQIKVDTPFHLPTEACLGCGACVSVCPTGRIHLENTTLRNVTRIASEYDRGLKGRKPIYIPYPQAIPKVPAIDREVCVHFKTGGCMICSEVCPANAIDYEQQDEIIELSVGSIILAPGAECFDPSGLDHYGYAQYDNVVTSIEFERILSASGPTLGRLIRPSDKQAPKKIAWIQCVGSRDTNRCDHGYCSSVCCMYAIKEAMIAKEHSHDGLDCAIFNMDIRAYAKDYEKYYQRASRQDGVRFIKSKVHTVSQCHNSGDLTIRYTDETGVTHEEVFDMVVLSVGLEPSKETIDTAKKLNIELDKYHFAVTEPFYPVQTSRPGVYVCGAFQGPKDIPASIAEASAAACAAETILAQAHNALTVSTPKTEEISVANQPPRVGVFICKCGSNIAGVVNVADLEDYCNTLPNVVFTTQNLFTCSQDAQEQMKAMIQAHGINRVVVASCSPKTHEPIFMDTLQAVGLNKYLIEMANIRNQNSWVHAKFPESATKKAKDLVRMAISRAETLKPLNEKIIPVVKRALVIGGGVGGMNAALSLAKQGFPVTLVEKNSSLGGMALKLRKTIQGDDIQAYLRQLIENVRQERNIEVFTDAAIVQFGGCKGSFETTITTIHNKTERRIKHGVVIVATGAHEYPPVEYGYGQDDRIMTQVQLSDRLETQGDNELASVVMIQCVGSRNDERPDCSRVCCQHAVKNALAIKKLNPETQIYVLYQDVRTYGLLEDYYLEARKQGVIFIRFEKDSNPLVNATPEGLTVTVKDHILQQTLEISADLVALSAGVVPENTDQLSALMKLNRNPEGYLMEAHVKLRPVDMATDGFFLCGTAQGPKLIAETVSQALAAASRASTLLSQSEIRLSALTAKVDTDRCVKCLTCVRSCPFGVPAFNVQTGLIEIDEAQCQGCGVCACACPRQAIQVQGYEDDQLLCKIETLLTRRL
jgi:heterodisulfide reductase subunit A